jgi:hypothetical protein
MEPDKIKEDEIGEACSVHGEMRNSCKMWVRNLEGNRPLGRPGVDGRIILKLILREQGGMVWIGFICLRIWTSGGFL